MEIVLLVWVLILMTGWLARFIAAELIAAARGHPSPQIARRRAREELRREFGTPTVGQALSDRLARRIENPPDRKWLRKMRGLLAELAKDALTEARVRHHRNRQAAAARRRARQSGWKVRTGGDPTARPAPPPPPEAPPQRTQQCRGCPALVVAPNELCVTCEQAETAPLPDLPDPDLPESTTDREGHPMAQATHNIDGDVRDPRTALKFAGACSGASHGVVGELDMVAANMSRVGVGPRPIQEIRVLADAARNHGRSADKSSKRYEQHAVAQSEIAADEDVAGTARRTYLDTHGSDGPATAERRRSSTLIRGADCDTPAAAARLMDGIAASYAGMKVNAEQVLNNHKQQGVTDEPIVFLNEQVELATSIAAQAKASAATFRAHIRRRDDTVGKDSSLHGTQKGKYLDPTRA